MSNREIERPVQKNWKRRIYIVGGGVGTVLGILSAYFYARSVEEDTEKNRGEVKPIATGDVLGLGLSLLRLVRQIAELGSPPSKKK